MISKEKAKTVMMVVDLHPRKLGSFEMFIIALSKELNKMGVAVVIAFASDVPDGLRHFYPGVIIESVSMSNGIFDSKIEMYKLFNKYKPDIVHFHFFSFFAFKNIPIFLLGLKRIIFTDHSSQGPITRVGFKNVIISLKNRFLIKYIEKIICVSNYILKRDENIPGMDKDKLLCIYNGVNLDRFQPTVDRIDVRKELNLRKNDFVVVTAVSLIEVKGIDYLIRAAKILPDKDADIHFLVAGDGEQRAVLEALAKELCVDHQVQFLGMRNDVEAILAASDVYLYPSIWQEACALGLIEAMACGLPVIATNVGGTPEIVEDGVTGIIIEARDSRSIVDAVDALYCDNGKRKQMGLNSLKRAKDKFDLERQVNEVIAVYE